MDEDLKDLLDQLDSEPNENIVVVGKPKEQAEKSKDIINEVDSKIDLEIDTSEIDSIGHRSVTALASHEDNPTPRIDISKYMDKLDGVTDEILNACRSDRQEAQDVIHMLRREIEQSINNNKQPSRMYVDGLVKAVEVKANINMTAVKMIEANAKMLATTKAGMNVQVNNNNLSVAGNDKDLERILAEPLTADDDY